jgi:autotransporter family porin
LAIAIVAVFGIGVWIVGPSPVGRPSSSGYFSQLPAGSNLPTPSQCAGRVHKSTSEPRPENDSANTNKVTPPALSVSPTYTSAWNSRRDRITGDWAGDGVTPTTDELIQFYSCKWGLSDDWVRAEVVAESSWHQSAIGDWTTNFAHCPPDAPTRNQGTECAQSLGLQQIKWRFHDPAGYPAYRDSTAYHLDYYGWLFRGCLEGQKWIDGQLRPANDLRGCLGNWFSGEWYSSEGEAYYARVKRHYDDRPWLRSGF